jgi:hypothetical protein
MDVVKATKGLTALTPDIDGDQVVMDLPPPFAYNVPSEARRSSR